MPYTHKASENTDFWNFQNLRGPILAFVFGLVLIYQLFLKENALFGPKRRKAPQNDGLGELTSKLKQAMTKKGKNLTPKMESELREIDSMLNGLGSLSAKKNN